MCRLQMIITMKKIYDCRRTRKQKKSYPECMDKANIVPTQVENNAR